MRQPSQQTERNRIQPCLAFPGEAYIFLQNKSSPMAKQRASDVHAQCYK